MVCDEGVFVGATRTAVLGHAELGQRFWDRRYRDILFFCDMNVEKKFLQVSLLDRSRRFCQSVR